MDNTILYRAKDIFLKFTFEEIMLNKSLHQFPSQLNNNVIIQTSTQFSFHGN